MATNDYRINLSGDAAKVANLVPDKRNANRGTARGSELVGLSLRKYGAGRSILVDRNGKIIAGNKTAQNAAAAGIEDVIVVESDGTKLVAVMRTDLDLDCDVRARELAVADNRAGELGLEWDEEVLAALSEEIDLSSMFTDQELADIVGAGLSGSGAAPPSDFAELDENLETAYQCPKCGYEWSGKPK